MFRFKSFRKKLKNSMKLKTHLLIKKKINLFMIKKKILLQKEINLLLNSK